MFKIFALCSVIALCNAGLLPAQLAYNNHQQYEDAPANYQFEYSVHDAHTGDIKQQQETRQGDAVQGSYSLVEPDGHRRVVHYTADDHSGFNAVVERQGTIHPQAVAHAVHAAPVALTHAAPVALTHAAPVAIHAQPLAIQSHAQIAHAPLAVTHSLQSHAPLAVAQQAYVSHAPVAVAQQAYLAHSAIQPAHQQVYSQQVLGHGYAQQAHAPLAHAQSYSTSSITNHGVHGAYVH